MAMKKNVVKSNKVNKTSAKKVAAKPAAKKIAPKANMKITKKVTKPALKGAKAKSVAAKGLVKAISTAKVAPKQTLNPPKKPTLVTPKNTESKQYTQVEFYDCIQGYCGFSRRKEAKEFYNGFQEMIQSALKSGYKVLLPGLGKLQVRKTKARKGINPATREPISIPAKRKVAFTALKALRTAVL